MINLGIVRCQDFASPGNYYACLHIDLIFSKKLPEQNACSEVSVSRIPCYLFLEYCMPHHTCIQICDNEGNKIPINCEVTLGSPFLTTGYSTAVHPRYRREVSYHECSWMKAWRRFPLWAGFHSENRNAPGISSLLLAFLFWVLCSSFSTCLDIQIACVILITSKLETLFCIF